MSEFIVTVIGQLGSLPGSEAQQALSGLLEDTRLASWHGHLKLAGENQRAIHRDRRGRDPSWSDLAGFGSGGISVQPGEIDEVVHGG